MDRLVILLDQPANFVSTLLVQALLAAAARRTDLVVAGICVRTPKSHHRLWRRHALEQLRRGWRRWTGSGPRNGLVFPWPLNLPRLARQHRFRLIAPPARNLNEPVFVERLRRELAPTLGLTLLCGQRYGAGLLEALGHSANYHNGLLPAYRGLYATNWSLYHNEPVSGFGFHWMDAELDTGRVLLEGSVPVSATDDLWTVEYAKTQAACRLVPELLERLVQRAAGRPQDGLAGYYSAEQARQHRVVADPRLITACELQRRLRAFGSLDVRIGARWYRASRLEPITDIAGARSNPRLQTADQQWHVLCRYRVAKHRL